eukprot:m.230392 g.230392  ORF g.230392 m.230392 type:complete len:66 (+) comp17060_c1_seq1:1159-1356(+)
MFLLHTTKTNFEYHRQIYNQIFSTHISAHTPFNIYTTQQRSSFFAVHDQYTSLPHSGSTHGEDNF